MLRRKRYRLAEPEFEGFVEACIAGVALALVGDQHDRNRALAQPLGEVPVDRRDTGACVDDEHDHIGPGEGPFRLVAHSLLDLAHQRLVETGGIDLPALEVGNPSRSEEHTSELQSLMRISHDVYCLLKKINHHKTTHT